MSKVVKLTFMEPDGNVSNSVFEITNFEEKMYFIIH